MQNYSYPFAKQGIYNVTPAARNKRPRIKKFILVTTTKRK